MAVGLVTIVGVDDEEIAGIQGDGGAFAREEDQVPVGHVIPIGGQVGNGGPGQDRVTGHHVLQVQVFPMGFKLDIAQGLGGVLGIDQDVHTAGKLVAAGFFFGYGFQKIKGLLEKGVQFLVGGTFGNAV